MNVPVRARAVGFAVIALLVGVGTACSTGGSGTTKSAPSFAIYDSNPHPLPGNVASQGFECCSTSQFGDEIKFTGTARTLKSATVTMSSWAIHSVYSGFPGDAAGWNQPLTLKLYAVGPGDTLGTVLLTRTQLFHIPWRPEPDSVQCPTRTITSYADPPTNSIPIYGYGYKYQSTPGAPDTNCFNGKANQVVFDLKTLHVTVPDNVIWEVSFNTQTVGSPPIGAKGPYNSLNVGAQGLGASIGTDLDLDTVFINGAAVTNASVWHGYTPEIAFTANA
jgi:hypothetical protein